MAQTGQSGAAVTVCLVRHGKAGRADEDCNRRLTEDGKAQARWVGRRLGRLDSPIKLICTSPHLRARETSELISADLGNVKVDVVSELAPGADVDRLLGLIEGRKEQNPLCLVGHMPDLGELAAFLSWGQRGRVMDIPTGGIIFAEVAGDRAKGENKVKWVASPEDPE